MSVRRLASDAVQPESFAFTPENQEWAKTKIALYPEGRQQSAVILLLMRAQEQEGWLTKPAIEHVAQMLDMPKIRVLEVASFYTQFQLEPVGTKAHVQVCGTTPCMLRGAEDLRHVCETKIHPEPHHMNEDGTLSWEEVECLGACVNAPMVAIGDRTYEDLTPERLEEIIDAYAADKGDTIANGSQIGRQFSAPVTGQTTLLNVPDMVAPAADTAKEEGGESPAAEAASSEPLFAAPEGGADDLKMISGVGPVLEKKLNAIGVTQFAQLAAFSEDDIRKLDDALSFRGRIERDEWVKQAEVLARGGAEEYRKVFGKDPR